MSTEYAMICLPSLRQPLSSNNPENPGIRAAVHTPAGRLQEVTGYTLR